MSIGCRDTTVVHHYFIHYGISIQRFFLLNRVFVFGRGYDWLKETNRRSCERICDCDINERAWMKRPKPSAHVLLLISSSAHACMSVKKTGRSTEGT